MADLLPSSPILQAAFRSYPDVVRVDRHEFLQLVAPVAGALDMEIEREAGAVAAGRVAVVPPGAEHRYASGGANRFLVVDIWLEPGLARSFDPSFIRISPRLEAALQAVSIEAGAGGLADVTIATLLREYLLSGLDRAATGAGANPGPAPAARDVARRVRQVIDERWQDQISIAEIGALAGVSGRHAARCFAQCQGESIACYRMRRRLERSRFLLADSALTVGEVAARCGFRSQAHFSRAFRQMTGAAPGRWRAEMVSAGGNVKSASDKT